MTSRPILTPNADHPITLSPNPARIVVRVGATIIADTTAALTMCEAGHDPVHYIPREDVDMSLLGRSNHESYCPYKGDAGYFDLLPLGGDGANAVWTYETPFPAVGAIAGRVAFYADRVSIETG